jgi:hypothetical protein
MARIQQAPAARNKGNSAIVAARLPIPVAQAVHDHAWTNHRTASLELRCLVEAGLAAAYGPEYDEGARQGASINSPREVTRDAQTV